MACRLDGSKNLRTGLSVEFVSVEAKEEAFSDSFRDGLWVLFPYGRFNESTRCLAHRTAHPQPFVSGPLHEHIPIAGVHFWRGILH
jgi:hypothetical protein